VSIEDEEEEEANVELDKVSDEEMRDEQKTGPGEKSVQVSMPLKCTSFF
jgi:hypothetical protein